jgi:hypothetical protein
MPFIAFMSPCTSICGPHFLEELAVETPSISITQHLSFLQIFAFFARVQLHPSSYGTPVVLVGIFVIVFLATANPTINPLILLSVAMAVLLYHVVISPLVYAMNLLKIYSKPVIYTFGYKEVTIENLFFKLTFKWVQIAQIVESKKEFLITTSSGAFHMLLKSSIPPEQLDPLRHIVRDALGDRAKL